MRRIAALASAAALAACSTGPVGTARDPSYFEGLRPVAVELTSAIDGVGRVFESAYESAASRDTRLTDLRVGADLAIAADRAARLDPGAAYRDDHDRYLELIEEIRDLYRSLDGAVAAGDIAAAAAAAAAMEATAGRGFAGLSPEYCAEVTFDMRLCDPPPVDGTYDVALHRALADLAAGYPPLLRPAPPALTGEEPGRYLELIDPRAAALLTSIATGLANAVPPADLQDDHQEILALLAAAADAHTAGLDHGAVRDLLCEHADRLSAEAAARAAVFFGDDDVAC